MENNFDTLRAGENFLPNSDRTKRLMCIGNEWYFLTRENALPLGPFKSEDAAMKAVSDYTEFAVKASPKMLDKLQTHLTFES